MNRAWGASGYVTWRKLSLVASILILVASVSACSKTNTWKEEVLLHDGTTMIVTRSATRSGAGEIGQGPPVTEHSITFKPMGSKQSITWEATSTGNDIQVDVLALDIVQGTPYLATIPRGCLVYRELGRPNPPYIFFKYVDLQWRQIPLQEFPIEIKRPNVVINLYRLADIERAAKMSGFASVDSIKKINDSLQLEEFRTILRQPMIPTGKSASLVDCVFYSGLKAPYPIPSPDLAEPKK